MSCDPSLAIAAEREQRGECPGCGIRCYKLGERPGNVRIPLSVPGLVEDGQCLECCLALSTPEDDESKVSETDYCEADYHDCDDAEAFADLAAFGSTNTTNNFQNMRESTATRLVDRSTKSSTYSSQRSGSVDGSSLDKNMNVLSSDKSVITDQIGLVVNKCAQELQKNPPPSERRTFLVLNSIRNFISQSDNNKDVAVKFGVVPAIIAAMTSHRQSLRVQSKACSILCDLARDETPRREAIAAHAGITNILACMMTHKEKSSKIVQQEACLALYYITLTPQNACQLAFSQGVRTLIKVTKTFSTDQLIVQHALAVLQNVVQVQHESVAQPEIIEVLAALMLKNKKSKDILKNGCMIFNCIAKNANPTILNSMVWAHAVSCCLYCMKRNQGSAQVNLNMIETLHILASHRPEARFAVGDDGLVILLDCIKRFEKNVEIQENGCRLVLLAAKGSTCASVIKTLKKNREVIESARRNFKERCGNLADSILLLC